MLLYRRFRPLHRRTRLWIFFRFLALPLAILLCTHNCAIAGTVFLNQQENTPVCRGTSFVTLCTTTTSAGFLQWLKNNGKSFNFDRFSIVGINGTLGSMRITLDRIEEISNATVYLSTATVDRVIENTVIQCSDGNSQIGSNVKVKSPSNPSWAFSPCTFFSNGSVRLSWSPPTVAPECCMHYEVRLSTGSNLTTSETSLTISITSKIITATVCCVNHVGEMTATEEIIIKSNTDISAINIGTNSSGCEEMIHYQVTVGTNLRNQDVCVPSITNIDITCSTPSRNQTYSINNTGLMILCPAQSTETLNVIAIVTNAAGVTVRNATSAVALAAACTTIKSLMATLSVTAITLGVIFALVLIAVCFVTGVVLLIHTKYFCQKNETSPGRKKKGGPSISLKSIINKRSD